MRSDRSLGLIPSPKRLIDDALLAVGEACRRDQTLGGVRGELDRSEAVGRADTLVADVAGAVDEVSPGIRTRLYCALPKA